MGAKTLLSWEQFEALPEDGNQYELNNGELVTMPPPGRTHSEIIWKISKILSRFVDEKQIGRIHIEIGFILSRKPEITYRQPDISYLSKARLQAMGDTQFFEGAPDLAIEVVSPGNDAAELALKVEQYLAAGSAEVWVFYPKNRSVHVHKADGTVSKLSGTDTITTDLFPGWSARIAEFFQIDY